MNEYQATFVCSCEDRICEITIKGRLEKPEVCVYGRNVTHIIANGFPKWEIKAQRFRPDDRKGTEAGGG